MVKRKDYIEKLLKFKDIKIIKILSGVRRSGKSTVLDLYKDELVGLGIEECRIIKRLYTSNAFHDGYTSDEMYEDLKAAVNQNNGRTYLLLDEVQEVSGWEKAINSIFESCDVDIYVTGSNSKLLAGEISTYLSGRFVSIDIYTLSLAEFKEFSDNRELSKEELFRKYITLGGFPLIATMNGEARDSYQIVEGIFATVVGNDIARRHKILNKELFDRVVRFVMENTGKTFSANAIVKFLKSEQRSITVETVYNYLKWLEEAFIIYRCSRYDLQGKSVLKTQEKFYLSDISLKHSQFGFNPRGIAAMLENIVYLELRRRGYDVYVGKNADKEIDFIATGRDDKIYVQVCRELPEESSREIDNLLEINDNYPKYVISMDPLAVGNEKGVKLMYIADFLLNAEW